MALDAGALIMRHYRDGVTEEKKADKSPVTQADREAEALLEKALAELVPHIQVIGEEACAGSLLAFSFLCLFQGRLPGSRLKHISDEHCEGRFSYFI